MIKHRKLHPTSKDNTSTTLPCPDICDSTCPYSCDPYGDIYSMPPPPPLPPQTSPAISAKQSEHISPFVIVIVTLFGSCFFVIIFYLVVVKFCGRWNLFRPRQRLPEATNEEFLVENHGPAATDHPIWYIHTTGLQPSVISSITIFRYKKGDNFIESTECAVCLNEFQNGDTLRLLPKCSHAFHIPCIDTWLRSHVNCPVCRAGIVSSVAATTPVASNALNYNNLRPNEDSQMDNVENSEELNINQGRDEEFCENRTDTGEIIEVQPVDHDGQDAVDIVKISIVPKETFASRVIKDFHDEGLMDWGNNKRQRVRRSVSADSLLAQNITEVCLSECEDSSENLIIGADQDSSKKVGGNSRTLRIINGGSSVAQFLHKRPVRMKRSFSYSGRSLIPRQYSRNKSILPLSSPEISQFLRAGEHKLS